jgi:hypothetical protein
MSFLAAAFLCAMTASTAIASDTTTFHYAANLGTTTATVDAWAKPVPGEAFRVGGKLVVKSGAQTLLSADPWKLTGAEEGGEATGTAISLDGLKLASLSTSKFPEVLLVTSGCGADCSGATTVLTYSAATSAYRPVANADRFYGQLGDVVSRDGLQYVDATLASPFFDCHACGTGTTKLMIRVEHLMLTDEMKAFPNLLRADAQQAWSDYQVAARNNRVDSGDGPPFEDALFRYLADEVRLGNRAETVDRLRALPALRNEFDSFLSQSDERLHAGGIRW